MKYLTLYTQYMDSLGKPAYDQSQVKKMYEALFDKNEIVNFGKFEYTALRAPFLTHEVFTKLGYAIFHQDLLDVGVDVADHVKQYFFTGFLNDATAFEYAVPNVDFRTWLASTYSITTLAGLIARDDVIVINNKGANFAGTLQGCNLNWLNFSVPRNIFLDRNHLNGEVPREIKNLNVAIFDLYTNELEGSIIKEFNVVQGTRLYVHQNNFTHYEKGAISPAQSNLNRFWALQQVTAANNTGLPTESIDNILLDIRDNLLANPSNINGWLRLEGNFPHSGSQEILDAIDFITNPVIEGGMNWDLTIETP